jgi:hypothetical protein
MTNLLSHHTTFHVWTQSRCTRRHPNCHLLSMLARALDPRWPIDWITRDGVRCTHAPAAEVHGQRGPWILRGAHVHAEQFRDFVGTHRSRASISACLPNRRRPAAGLRTIALQHTVKSNPRIRARKSSADISLLLLCLMTRSPIVIFFWQLRNSKLWPSVWANMDNRRLLGCASGLNPNMKDGAMWKLIRHPRREVKVYAKPGAKWK